MTDVITFLRYFFIGFAVAGILGIVAIRFMRKRALSGEQAARWSGRPGKAVSSEEMARLVRWQRRMRIVAVSTLFYLGVMVGFASAVSEQAEVTRWIAFLILPAMVIAGVALQFSVRCPRCGMLLGLQSSLAVPKTCERCGSALRL